MNINLELLKEITKDSFTELLLDNSFTVFKTINDLIYLIYATKDKSIISYNIIGDIKINQVMNAHEEYISNIRYFSDKNDKKDLFLSLSASDNNIKLWNVHTFECLLNLKNINKKGEIFSSCFF